MKTKILSILFMLFLISFQGCVGHKTSHNLSKANAREILILEKIADKIIEQEQDFIVKRNERVNYQTPLFLDIGEEWITFDGFKCFIAFFSERGLSQDDLPSCLLKKRDLYVTMYQKDQVSLLKQNIPQFLFKDYEDTWRNESEWLILICNDSYKCSVINKDLIPYKAIKQFQEFSCSTKEDKLREIKIEDPIIDYPVLDSIMNSIQFAE